MPPVSEAFAIAMAHHQAGRVDLAAEICRRIVAVEPGHAQAWEVLGLVAHQQGRNEEAVESLRAAVRADGRQAHFHNNLGVAYAALGNTGAAVECYQRALALQPDHADAYGNLGLMRQAQRRLPEAVECFRQALRLNPHFIDAWKNLAAALHELGQSEEAARCCRQALELQPNDPLTYYNLGTIVLAQGQVAEAVDCYRRCLALAPEWAEAHYNLGNAMVVEGKLDEAVECFQRAAALRPGFSSALSNLGTACLAQGRLDEAVASFRRALELEPGLIEAHDNLLYTLHYRSGVSPEELLAAHRGFDESFAAPLRSAWRRHEKRPDPDGRLRLGFVSPDFGRHPVGCFLAPVLETLDRRECEVFCYSNRLLADETTLRLQAASTQWRNVFRLSDEQLAEQIRADQVDILFDLAGHTAHNRLGVFARKPALLQIAWIGYPGSTGLQAMDCLLADRFEVPPGAESHYSERVLRMPEGYVCFEPPQPSPAVGPLPALSRGHVTFASFNNPAKLSVEAVAAWGAILRRLPSARMVLAYRGYGSSTVGTRVRSLFARHGVSAERIELLDWVPRDALLERYNQVDLVLDTFPYNGGLTTCEALWMGVPVVTWPGETFASRHSLSHLSAAGFTATIARDPDEYIALAATLASDLPRLAEIRAGLRAQVARSPLCDVKRFAADLLRVLRTEIALV